MHSSILHDPYRRRPHPSAVSREYTTFLALVSNIRVLLGRGRNMQVIIRPRRAGRQGPTASRADPRYLPWTIASHLSSWSIWNLTPFIPRLQRIQAKLAVPLQNIRQAARHPRLHARTFRSLSTLHALTHNLSQDLRNHGHSPHVRPHDYSHMAKDLGRFMSEHGLEQGVNLVGHSM
jgi:hypothetical protein